jgi:hypothetical protein
VSFRGYALIASRRYAQPVKEIWTGRAAQAAGKYAEHAPMATACCNACRTCVQTNLIGVGVAAVTGAGLALARFARRFVVRPS